MYEDEKVQALLNFYDLLERHKIPKENAPVIGSFALGIQGKLRKHDKPKDIDLFLKKEEDFDAIFNALRKEGTEVRSYEISRIEGLADELFGSIESKVLVFRYADQRFEIFSSDQKIKFGGNADVVEELDITGKSIYVRPAELIKADYEKIIRIFYANLDILELNPIFSKVIPKYEERLKYI